MLVPVRASPVPSVVRGSLVVKFFFLENLFPRVPVLSRSSRRLASAAAAAPSPDTPPPARLLDLPTELLARALSRCDPSDIARVAAISLLFHASLALEGIRLWARERSFELTALPEGESCPVRWLCLAALLREANPPARAAAGDMHSVFIDGEGRLSSCGSEAGYPGLLGHGEGVTRLNMPTRLPSSPLGGERAVSVAAGGLHSLTLTADGAASIHGRRPRPRHRPGGRRRRIRSGRRRCSPPRRPSCVSRACRRHDG